MRFGGLLVLALFFPAFAHAASPSLTTYTISHDTLYPSATADSGLATTTTIDVAFSEQVKASIKILSANGTTVKSLYSSSSVTNPTPKVWDGTNNADAFVDNGTYTVLISATSTATSLTMADSSKTVTVASSGGSGSSGSDSEAAPTTTPATATTGGAPPEYIPIPTLRIITAGDRVVSSGADTAFTAVVYDGKGNKRDDALVTWSFGDGMRRTGASVFHTYYSPGEYLAVIHVTTTSDGGNALSEVVVTVKDAGIKISSVSSKGITLMNKDSRTLDLSLWRLSMGGREFKIPEDTQILAGRSILFPSQVIELPVADSASLLYPGGEVAAVYPQTSIEQPQAGTKSYKKVSEVEPTLSARADVPIHEEAVNAPAAANGLAAAGAAVSLAPPEQPKTGGLLRSPWLYGLFGIIALAGTAFIFL